MNSNCSLYGGLSSTASDIGGVENPPQPSFFKGGGEERYANANVLSLRSTATKTR